MSTIQVLVGWAVRSSILILAGALLMWLLRVKDPAIRLAAWTAILCGSLALPALTTTLPGMPLTVMRATAPPVEMPVVSDDTVPAAVASAPRLEGAAVSPRFNWTRAAFILYAMVAFSLLLRLCVGLAMSLRLLRQSRATGQTRDGIGILESDGVEAPVTLGIVRPAIVLPGDWRRWDGATLDAVLAHESSHIGRRDPAVQLVSAIHRALLWHSPLSWFLHKRIVRLAEEASDDMAVAVTRDRAHYAKVLLEFMQRGAGLRGTSWIGVPMARYGRADRRIHRILDSTTLSRGVTRWSMVAILAMVSPVAYVVAAAHPQSVAAQNHPAIAPQAVAPSGQSSRDAVAQPIRIAATPRIIAQATAPPAPHATSAPEYLVGLGNVLASTVTVRSLVDGQLKSVGFKEGEPVHSGQIVATIDQTPNNSELDKAMQRAQIQRDELQMLLEQQKNQAGPKGADVARQLENSLEVYRDTLENMRFRMGLTEIKAPITGIAGLRLVEPGNIVHASDAGGIVTIAQIQPIAVAFTLPEKVLPQVRALLNTGVTPEVDAWNADNSVKIATGRLTGMDNQIDQANGTVKLKATFDNNDSALFPNQFVNVRLLMNGR